MIEKVINRFVLLPLGWRFSFITIVGLISAFILYQHIIKQQNFQIQQYRNQLLNLKTQISNHQNNQKQMLVEQNNYSRLNQQLAELKKLLQYFDHNVPERMLLDLALKSKIKPDEIKISRKLDDEFGHYIIVNMKIMGDPQNVSQFFSKLLGRNELSIWDELTFSQVANQLSMNLTTRYYIKIFNDDSE